jgi:hypothetical protein
MANASSAHRVFVSHARSDDGFASSLAAALKQSGADAVLDSRAVDLGTDVQEAVLAALRASDLVVFVVPEREGAGKNALVELGAARALGKRIVAIAPDSGRLHNADVARLLSGSAVVDASAVTKDALVRSILRPQAA